MIIESLQFAIFGFFVTIDVENLMRLLQGVEQERETEWNLTGDGVVGVQTSRGAAQGVCRQQASEDGIKAVAARSVHADETGSAVPEGAESVLGALQHRGVLHDDIHQAHQSSVCCWTGLSHSVCLLSVLSLHRSLDVRPSVSCRSRHCAVSSQSTVMTC